MTLRRMLPSLAFLALTACATTRGHVDVRSISFETGPCFGACPVYRVTVDSEGNGAFEGRRFTQVTGVRSFRISREQFRTFARHLQPLRPERGAVRYAGETCANLATDMPSADVTWRSLDGQTQALHFYFGCDPERNQAMAERLTQAPRLLPIDAFVGWRDR